MKLSKYLPSFRQVLVTEIKEEQTKGGIFLPPSSLKDELLYQKLFLVEKIGQECQLVKKGDVVKLDVGARLIPVEFEDSDSNYMQVLEMQIIGFERG